MACCKAPQVQVGVRESAYQSGLCKAPLNTLGPVADWTVADVVTFVRDMVGLRDAASAFEVNVVNGELLKTLTDEDLKTELTLLPLQIRRFRLELGKLA